MIDRILLKRIWQDEYFFELQLFFENELIKVTTKVYVCDDHIEQLKKGIESLLKNKQKDFLWETGER